MSKDIRWKQRLDNLKDAVRQLHTGLAIGNPDNFQKQGVIKCFEYTFDLAWKTIQDYLKADRGYTDISGPRPVLQQAFQDQIIRDGELWFNMLESRNLSSHIYDSNEMEKIFRRITIAYLNPFDELVEYLVAK